MLYNNRAGERLQELSPRKTPTPALLRGSLIVLKRRCGKSNCHCAQGDPHETPALSYSVGGETGILTLRREDVPGVKVALARYKRALRQLDNKAVAGIERLRRRIEKEKGRAPRKSSARSGSATTRGHSAPNAKSSRRTVKGTGRSTRRQKDDKLRCDR